MIIIHLASLLHVSTAFIVLWCEPVMQMWLCSLPLDPKPGVFQLYFLLFVSAAALEASTAFEGAPEDFIY